MMAGRAEGGMRLAMLDRPDDFGEWRDHARALLAEGVGPEHIRWRGRDTTGDLFDVLAPAVTAPTPQPAAKRPVTVPAAFLTLAETVCLHRDPARFDLLYRLLWRLQADRRLIDDKADADRIAVEALAREVRHDIHKMRAFVRFRETQDEDGTPHFIAWFEPAHHILRTNAAFFVNRFTTMRWSILTPMGSLHWNGASLTEGPAACRSDAPREDAAEALWKTYYAAIFNPARLKVGTMVKEMPRRYWKNMPEAALIPDLIAGARAREVAMIEAGRDMFEGAERPTCLGEVARAIAACRLCPIGCNGTRAVPGQGSSDAALMIVGEQPGDVEEVEGWPFVGPAGRLLSAHLAAVGIDRGRAYLTNAVKHFKFTPRGTKRIHETPSAREIDLCRWWLDSERALVKPRLILALGASAARGILGKTVSVQKVRGQPQTLRDGSTLWITTHPSYLLRLPEGARAEEEARFAEDLAHMAAQLGGQG